MSDPNAKTLLTDNEEQLLFYAEIGRAITNWAHVELALHWAVASCFDDADFQMHGAAFFAVENFRSKLQVADAVIRRKCKGTPQAADWADLHNRLAALSQARNKLAHYWVLGDPSARAGKRFMLLPRIAKPGAKEPKVRQKQPGAIYVQDIVLLGQRLNVLARTLENFASRVAGRPERIPKDFEQEPRPQTMRSLTDHIRAYNVRPHRSSRG